MSDNPLIAMELVTEEPRIATSAQQRAKENFRRNCTELARFQPALVPAISNSQIDIEWVFGRDGYLTGRIDSAWWNLCSVPLLTGRHLLKKLELDGIVGCFLSPSHAGQVRACLEKIHPSQAIVAVVPNLQSLWVLLHCDDFAAEISAARLFFAAGDDWAKTLAELFKKNPGLALPQQFVRTALLDDTEMTSLSSEAQTIISRETDRRARKMGEMLDQPPKPPVPGRVLLLAGSRLNLSDLSNIALRQALVADDGDSSFVAFDPEYPLTSSPLALAEAVAEAESLMAADLFRADLPGMVGPKTRWITWATRRRIVPASAALPHDRLILADPQWRKLALDEGWKPGQIQIAGWPRILPRRELLEPTGFLAMLCDLRQAKMPQRVKDFSSQRLLWEWIDEELTRNPQALGADPDWYLNSRIERLNIGSEGLDRAMFFEKLIEPAYAMGLARILLQKGAPIRLIGRGWDEIEEFRAHACGPVASIEDLSKAMLDCRAILPSFPKANSLEGLGLPVVRASELSRVKYVLKAKSPAHHVGSGVLRRDIVRANPKSNG